MLVGVDQHPRTLTSTVDVVRFHGVPALRALTVVAILLVLTATWGCSEGSAAHLPAFSDIRSAPSPIQEAAKAVVRIHTAGSYGTGAFISPSGFLLTNNHVLGAGVCPIEGCHVQLAFMHQRGELYRQSITVLAVPVAVAVNRTVATRTVPITVPVVPRAIRTSPLAAVSSAPMPKALSVLSNPRNVNRLAG